MVGVKELKEKRLNLCRSVVNNFSIVKIDGLAVLGEYLDGGNLIISQEAIGIKKARTLLTAQLRNRRS